MAQEPDGIGDAFGHRKAAIPPADTIHPKIHEKVGQGDGTNANPNGVNENGGNIHGIGNAPGQNAGNQPNDDGTNGFANQLETVHGGIGDYRLQSECRVIRTVNFR